MHYLNTHEFLLTQVIYFVRALCKKIFQKNRKTTPTGFIQTFLGIPKMYLACLSDHCWVRNDFLKLTGAPLNSPTFALNSALQIIGRVLSIGKILFGDLLNIYINSNSTKQYEKGYAWNLSVWKTFPRKNKVSFWTKMNRSKFFSEKKFRELRISKINW